MTDAELDAIRAGIHGIECWLSEALGDAPDGAEPTAESLRLSAETLAKRITALADHLEGRPSDLDLGVYDAAGGSFGRVLSSTRRLLAERAAFVRADEARVDVLEQIWIVLGGPALPADPHNEPPVSGDVECDALELARRIVADRDRLAAAIAEHHAQKADDRCIEDDDRLYAAAGLPPCDRRVGSKEEMLANCARFIERRCESGGWPTYRELEADCDRLAARVAELEGRPSVPPPSEKPACIPPETPV